MHQIAHQIARLCAQPANHPMASPFVTAKRTSSVAENVLITVALSGGAAGAGEASPAPYVTGETAESVLAEAESLAGELIGLDVRCVARWSDVLKEAGPTCRSAIEMALLDALTRSLGLPLYVWYGGAQTSVQSDFTLSIGPVAKVAERAGAAAAQGFRALKIKVGGPSRDEDLERVIAISRAAPGVRLRLDANQAFTPDAALDFLAACERHGVPVELMEQPVPADDFEGLAAVTARSPVPVIADEAVVDARSALRLVTMRAAHGINIKVAKAGMVGALPIIAIARAAGLRLMLGCMMESHLGIAAALHLACGTGAFDYLDLDSHLLIGLPTTGAPFAQEGDELRLPPGVVGHGWAPGGAGEAAGGGGGNLHA